LYYKNYKNEIIRENLSFNKKDFLDLMKNPSKNKNDRDPINSLNIDKLSLKNLGANKINMTHNINRNLKFKELKILANLKETCPQLLRFIFFLKDKLKTKKRNNIINYCSFRVIFKKIEIDSDFNQKNAECDNLIYNSFYSKIKFTENDMILYKINKNKNCENFLKERNHSDLIYFYRLSNIIFDDLPSIETSKIDLHSIIRKNYYSYGFSYFNQKYKIYFEKFEDLICFFECIQKLTYMYNNTFSLLYKNLKDIRLTEIKNKINTQHFQKKFTYFNLLIDSKSKSHIKIQTINKIFMSYDNKIFLKNILSLFRINNLFSFNFIPIYFVYEDKDYFFIQYSSDNFIIDNHKKDIILRFKNLEFSNIYKLEQKRFLKIIDILKVKKEIYQLFELLNLQDKYIFS